MAPTEKIHHRQLLTAPETRPVYLVRLSNYIAPTHAGRPRKTLWDVEPRSTSEPGGTRDACASGAPDRRLPPHREPESRRREKDRHPRLPPRHALHFPPDQPANPLEPGARASAHLARRPRSSHDPGTRRRDDPGQRAAGGRRPVRGRPGRVAARPPAENAARRNA